MHKIPTSTIAGLLGAIQRDTKNEKALLLTVLNYGISEVIMPQPYKDLYIVQRSLFEAGEQHTRLAVQRTATELGLLEDTNIQTLIEEVSLSSATITFKDALAISQEYQIRKEMIDLSVKMREASKAKDLKGAVEKVGLEFIDSAKVGERSKSIGHHEVVEKCRNSYSPDKSEVVQVVFPDELSKLRILYRMMCAGMHIVASRPKVGKTSYIMYLLNHMAKCGLPIGVMSLEMDGYRLVDRLVAQRMHESTQSLQLGHASEGKMARADKALDEIDKLPFHWSDKKMTIGDIRKWIGVKQATEGVNIFVLDHIGKITADKRYDSSYAKMTEYSNELSAMASQMGVVLIVICHIKRKEKGRPTMDDLRDTGHLEQDAESILILSELGDEDAMNLPHYRNEDMKYVMGDMVANRSGEEWDFLMEYSKKTQGWSQV